MNMLIAFTNPWVVLLLLFLGSVQIAFLSYFKPQTEELTDVYFDACVYPGKRP